MLQSCARYWSAWSFHSSKGFILIWLQAWFWDGDCFDHLGGWHTSGTGQGNCPRWFCWISQWPSVSLTMVSFSAISLGWDLETLFYSPSWRGEFRSWSWETSVWLFSYWPTLLLRVLFLCSRLFSIYTKSQERCAQLWGSVSPCWWHRTLSLLSKGGI